MDFRVNISEEETLALLCGRMVTTWIEGQHAFRKDTR